MAHRLFARSAFISAVVLLITAPAWADGVRYDTCDVAGASCHNAVAGHRADDPSTISSADQAVQPGTCENAKCERGGPDGGVVFDCLRCIASDDQGCSCRTGAGVTRRSLAVLMLFVGLAALAWSRRRR